VFALLAGGVFTLFYRYGRENSRCGRFFTVTSILLYYMAFVFMGKGIRELQEGNIMRITVIPGRATRRCDGHLPEASRHSQLRRFLVVPAYLRHGPKTFWARPQSPEAEGTRGVAFCRLVACKRGRTE